MSYSFQEPLDSPRNSSLVPSPTQPEVSARGENVSLSFRTFQNPVLLLYVSSFSREFLALLINNGEEERLIHFPVTSLFIPVMFPLFLLFSAAFLCQRHPVLGSFVLFPIPFSKYTFITLRI